MSTGIRQYFTVVEREECDLPSSKHSRLEGDQDDSDGSSMLLKRAWMNKNLPVMKMTAAF